MHSETRTSSTQTAGGSSMSKTSVRVLAVLWLASQVSASVYNAPCGQSSECARIYNSEYECVDSHCLRRQFDYSRFEILGFCMIIVISMITNAGGVGAGTIIIPAYIVFFDFVSSDAIPLSRITIFAGSLVNYIINWTQRDPHNEKRFLINYSLASVMMPLLLAGTQVGVILSRFLPAASITLILVFYLTSSARQMYQRARKDSQKEKELEMLMLKGNNESQTSALRNDSDLDQSAEILAELEDEQASRARTDSSGSRETNEKKKSEPSQPLTTQQKKERDDYRNVLKLMDSQIVYKIPLTYLIRRQWPNFVTILFSFFVLFISSIMRGGEGRSSVINIESCGKFSWAIFFATQLFSTLLAIYAYRINQRDFQEEDHNIKDRAEAEARIETRKRLLWASYTTGILAGLLGVGGGMILGLYMLSLGMDVQVSTALSTFVVLFSSSATTFQFIVAGAIHLRHAYIFMCLSLVGSLIGNLVLKAILKKYRRPSVLIWILFGVLCIATAVLPLEMLLNLTRKATSAIAFGPFC